MKINKKNIPILLIMLTLNQISFGEDLVNKIATDDELTKKTYPISVYLDSSIFNIDPSGKGTSIKWLEEPIGVGNPLIPNFNPIFKNGADKVYGLDIIPNISKQSFDLFRNSNQFIYNYFIDDHKHLEIGETSYSIGINNSLIENSGYDNVSGYDTNQNGAYFGIKYKLIDQLSLGGVLSIGQSDTNFDNSDSSRENTYFQGNFYLDYRNNKNLRFTSMFFWGKINSDLDRSYNSTLYKDGKTISQTNNSSMNNYYFGINNRIENLYNINMFDTSFYYKPQFEFNFAYLMQDSIKETANSNNYNDSNINSELSLGEEESYSLNSSVGISLGKDFIFKNTQKLNLELKGSIFLEFGEPYSNLTNSSNFNDKIPVDRWGNQTGPATGTNNKIDGYDFDTIFYIISLTGRYEINEAFSFYSSLNSIWGENQNSFQGNLGLSYDF